MPVTYDFEEYIGKDVPLTIGAWKVMPNSAYKPSQGGCILTPNIYINLQYVISDTAKKSGKLWVRLMRESPDDGTMNYHLDLNKGYTSVLDSRSFQKRWSSGNLGRGVHVEVKVTGVTSAYLNDTCYVAYSQIW